ncbi:DUF7674 family protein [Kordia zhangzhouensis]|uniref:DUF7674 family protein n=1 Tax=Kordia zhangzhouensis TaxID=1620405 RepID=UPI0006296521|nr:hypothetical protein [Kordia zhangzhouensis]
MIKRNIKKEKYYLGKLSDDVPEFLEYEEFENLIYNDYDRLGTYILKNAHDSKLLKKIFSHLNSIFELENKLVLNILDVCIYEALITNKLGYSIAEKYMSKEMKKNFLNLFPYEKHKNDWDTDNYYTEEEFKKIIDSLNNGTD